MTGPAVLITLALVFYSTGVWAERIVRYLKPWHVAAFWTGFAFDVAGTWAMHRLATGPFDLLAAHTLTGQIALWLMLIHAAWATRVVRAGTEQAREGFHRYSVIVWLIWLIPYFGGMYMGMSGESDISTTAVVPSESQVDYQRMEMIGFVHFTVNTFTDREWGYGDESPEIFRPTDLDADQWASVAAEVGMKELILTAKHHDGFALWPSAYTEHSVRHSPWRDGEGDLVREFVDASREHGLKVGLYLSPWDRNHADYGRAEYLDYYRDQLRELLTDYGPITEIWVDGANGGSGWYGGADEERRIDRETYYDWPATWSLVKSLQPETLVFSDAGPDIRWIGNEHGYAGETNWSTINTEGVVVGAADTEYLNSGDPDGAQWVVPLCDTSIRPGWFYHASEDEQVKTVSELLEVYYRSVGRNCVLLLNVPPDTRGLFHENDIAVLREFRRILDETFDVDLAADRPVTGASHRGRGGTFSPAHLVDGDPDSYWAAHEGLEATVEIDLGRPTYFDRIMLQEPIRLGQRIAAFTVEARVEGDWARIARGTTVGHKRLLRVPGVEADRVRISIDEALALPALSRVGLFEASSGEKTGKWSSANEG
ncbi:MAG: HsmA family protein [Gemmatimonadota bacterium]